MPKDIRAFAARAEELGSTRLICVAVTGPQLAVDALCGSVFKKNVTVLGAAYKPHSDDIRNSPALDVAVRLHGLSAWVTITDREQSRMREPDIRS